MSDKNPLAVQVKAILQKYTKSSRIDEMVDDIIEAVKRDAPKVQVAVPIEPCQHMYRLLKQESGQRELVCKKCGRVKDLELTQKEDNTA